MKREAIPKKQFYFGPIIQCFTKIILLNDLIFINVLQQRIIS